MHEKQIRRRRTVLVVLVVICLILLAGVLGELPTGSAHSVADGAVSPVRAVTGWFSSTFHAKSQVSDLKQKNALLKHEIAAGQYDSNQYAQDQGLLRLDQSAHLNRYDPVAANVTGKNPVLWYDTVEVDRGTSAGVHVNDAVIGKGGLVGKVTAVQGDQSTVTLVTSSRFSVGAMASNGQSGILQPAPDNPSTLVLSYLPITAQINYGQEILTSGFRDASDPSIRSFAPVGIPIGFVSNENTQDTVQKFQNVDVRPSVDLQYLSVVQILIHAS